MLLIMFWGFILFKIIQNLEAKCCLNVNDVLWSYAPFPSLQTPPVSFWSLFGGHAVWEGHRTHLNRLLFKHEHRFAECFYCFVPDKVCSSHLHLQHLVEDGLGQAFSDVSVVRSLDQLVSVLLVWNNAPTPCDLKTTISKVQDTV